LEIWSDGAPQVVHCVAVDCIAEVRLLRRGNEALGIDGWQVGHAHAQQVLGTMTSAKSRLDMARAKLAGQERQTFQVEV
jgi:hypothetical protein